jgi:hypothetical protein
VSILSALALVSCNEPSDRQGEVTSPLAASGTSVRSIYGEPIYLTFVDDPTTEIYVEQTGPFSPEYDFAGSRCPDEPILRPGTFPVFLTGRTLKVSAIDEDDPNQRLIHFTIPFDMLAFAGYQSVGPLYSKAKYKLAAELLSDDFESAAPQGATVVVSCKGGKYVGPANYASILALYARKVLTRSMLPTSDRAETAPKVVRIHRAARTYTIRSMIPSWARATITPILLPARPRALATT